MYNPEQTNLIEKEGHHNGSSHGQQAVTKANRACDEILYYRQLMKEDMFVC